MANTVFVKTKHGLKSDPYSHGQAFRFRGPTRDKFIGRNNNNNNNNNNNTNTNTNTNTNESDILFNFFFLCCLCFLFSNFVCKFSNFIFNALILIFEM